MKKVKILVACATGVATSTIVTERIHEICKANGINAEIVRSNIGQIPSHAADVDIIMPTTNYSSDDIDKPIINALAFITGINEDQVIEQLLEAIEELNK
ncbi:MAG TPA: PTS sugar transporter subunit IIB [Tepidimicrobium sp.]|nr:PTS sugar transporter subunit IIB [Tepidimicrobium sp.]